MLDFRGRSRPLVKVRQVRAATQRYVLAIIDMRAVRQRVGSRATAQIWPLLKQANANAGFRERCRGRQSRQSAADHDYALKRHRG